MSLNDYESGSRRHGLFNQTKFNFLDSDDTRELKNMLGTKTFRNIFEFQARGRKRFQTQMTSTNFQPSKRSNDSLDGDVLQSETSARKRNGSLLDSTKSFECSPTQQLKNEESKRFDRLHPSNNMSRLSYEQKVLGHASKVKFEVKPNVLRENRIKMESWKAPALSKNCKVIEEIIDNYRAAREQEEQHSARKRSNGKGSV